MTRTADGDAQGAVPSLRAMVTLREGADGAAKAEREDAIGPDAPDLPYLDKAQQAKDIIAAWKATTRKAEHLAKTTKRAELSDTFITTPPVMLAKYKDDPAPTPETPPAQLAAPQSTERRPQLLKGKATPQGAPIRLAQGGLCGRTSRSKAMGFRRPRSAPRATRGAAPIDRRRKSKGSREQRALHRRPPVFSIRLQLAPTPFGA